MHVFGQSVRTPPPGHRCISTPPRLISRSGGRPTPETELVTPLSPTRMRSVGAGVGIVVYQGLDRRARRGGHDGAHVVVAGLRRRVGRGASERRLSAGGRR